VGNDGGFKSYDRSVRSKRLTHFLRYLHATSVLGRQRLRFLYTP
jgi:hypothetical protein